MGEASNMIQFYQFEDIVINVPEEDFELTPDCCIYQVPKCIRQSKPVAYTPQLISIGPFHFGNEKLVEMENQKLRYLKKFCERTSKHTLEKLLSFIRDREGRIRNCYAKSLSEEWESPKFIKMILNDAIFIIELFLRHFENKDDFLLNKPWLDRDLVMDLLLLENQLPYFVVEGIYELASLPSACPPFFELACSYFNIKIHSSVSAAEIKHFTDLKRWELVDYHPYSSTSSGTWMDDLCSATKLREAGVEFKAEPERSCLLDINFVKKQLLVPPLIVHPYTESHIRNVIALEQCHYPRDAYVCAYVDLMDHLINTDEDVELLTKKGVVLNRMGSAAAVADMINNLLEGVEEISNCYEGIAMDLIQCHRSTLNRTMATLKQVYFPNLLRGTASVAAFLVVLFTFTQTLVAILERVNPLR